MHFKSAAVPSCCTARVIHDFKSDWYFTWPGQKVKKERRDAFKSYLIKRLRYFKNGGYGIITAYLTDRQKVTMRILKSVGFSCSEAATKTRHHDTKLYVLSINLDKLKDK